MFKKSMIGLSVVMLIAIFSINFYLNFKLRAAPPSNEWSKEVLLTEGKIQSPKLIKYKDSYTVAYGDGKNIKIIKVDSIGRKIAEKVIPIKSGKLKDIYLFTNDKDLFIVSQIIVGNSQNIVYLRGNENYDFDEVETIQNVSEVVHIDNNVMALGFWNKIELIDFRENKKADINVYDYRFLMGSKNKDGYILAYLASNGDIQYVTVKNGRISEPKLGGILPEITYTYFQKATLIANNNDVDVLMEYKYRLPGSPGEFIDTKLLTFSLDSNKYNSGPVRVNGENIVLSNISQFSNGKENSILATASRDYGKKKSFEDILKFDVKNGKFVKTTPLSRSNELSVDASGSEDTAVFCDVLSSDNYKLYMVSSREDFKKANNTVRINELKLALVDTLDSMIYSSGYIIIYSMLWVLPCLLIAAILTVLEYRLSKKGRHFAFIFACIIATLIKCYFVNKISYGRYRMMLPKLLNPWAGIGICILISAVFYIPGYFNYKKDEGNITISLPFSVSLFLESFFTVMLFGSFLV